MALGDVLDERESDAAATGPMLRCRLAANEPIEDACAIRGVDAGPVVTHTEERTATWSRLDEHANHGGTARIF